MRLGAIICAALLALVPACVGTTGGERVTFTAAAAGPADVFGHALSFTSGRGFHVVLTQATIHIGALYLNQSLPVSGAQSTDCVLPGTYVAEETTGRDIDLLDATPQIFPDYGDATTTLALAGEVWLKGPGSVSSPSDATPILIVEGQADDGKSSWPFAGQITIGSNRVRPVSDPSQPSAHPICKERIVSPIALSPIRPTAGGTLLVRVDPRQLFVNVDFASLKQFSTDPPRYGFVDSDADQPSISLYQALRAAGGLYAFSWLEAP
jgi:hypothetical protein